MPFASAEKAGDLGDFPMVRPSGDVFGCSNKYPSCNPSLLTEVSITAASASDPLASHRMKYLDLAVRLFLDRIDSLGLSDRRGDRATRWPTASCGGDDRWSLPGAIVLWLFRPGHASGFFRGLDTADA